MADSPRFRVKRPLLLQGPMGTFFRRFASELRAGGAVVKKINFNAGDSLSQKGFARPGRYMFRRDALESWRRGARTK